VGTPDPGVYFRIIKEHNVAGLFVAPTALRAIRRDVRSCFVTYRVLFCLVFLIIVAFLKQNVLVLHQSQINQVYIIVYSH